MTHTIKTFVEIPVEVEFVFHKGEIGSVDKTGKKADPDTHDEVELLHVWTDFAGMVNNGQCDIKGGLPQRDLDYLEDEIWDKVAEKDDV